jgi:hypothetical protein
VFCQLTANIIAVSLAGCRLLYIKNRLMIARDLQRFVALFRRPSRQPLKGVERGLSANKLRQKNTRG